MTIKAAIKAFIRELVAENKLSDIDFNDTPAGEIVKTESTKSKLIENMFDAKTLTDNTSKVLQEISDVLRKSYGPYGANTVIRQGGEQLVTKDGLAILKSMKIPTISADTIYRLVMSISSNLVQKVGDGSTSAILAANEVYKVLKDTFDENDQSILDTFRTRKQFVSFLDLLQKDLETIIKRYYTYRLDELSQEDKLRILTTVATLSNNNDKSIGQEVAQLMSTLSSHSVVAIKLAPDDNEGLKINNRYGYHTTALSMVHPSLFKSETSVELENPMILQGYEFFDFHSKIVDGIKANMSVVANGKDGKLPPIVVIADVYQAEIIQKIVQESFLAKELSVYYLKTESLESNDANEKFLDLAAYIKTDPLGLSQVSPDNIKDMDLGSFIGNARKVTITPQGVLFETGAGVRMSTEAYTKRMADIQKELDETSKNLIIKRGQLRNRLASLVGVHSTIFVGGRTEDEKTSIKELVEDSVLACQSVMRNGYTMGGNVVPLYALITLKALYEVDPSLNLYKYNEDMCAWNVINDLIIAYVSLAMIPFENRDMPTDAENDYEAWLSYINDMPTKVNTFYEDSIELSVGEIECNAKSFPKILNIVNDEIESITTTSVLAPVETDLEILRASFSIVGLLLNSNQLSL
jgi:chaperonin GroEL